MKKIMTGKLSPKSWRTFSKVEMIKLSIIVLSYNTKDLVIRCLQSVEAAVKGLESVEIIVVDNGSTDNSVESIKVEDEKIQIIENGKNLGFAKGNNLGLKKATGKFILLLNSDTLLEKDTIHKMLKFMEENPQIGVATCRVEFPDGSLDPACHRGFPTPWASLSYFLGLEKLFPKSRLFGQYHLGYLPIDKPHEIDSPSGAFYFLRREVIEKVGFLDEDYFMYGEDLDWSYRIKQAGFKIFYYPGAKITHFKKQSGRASEENKIRRETKEYFYETMKIFYRKHYLKKYPSLLNFLMMVGIEIKKALSNN